MPTSFGVHHLALLVTDLEAAERFYSGVLGLPVLRRWRSEDGLSERSLWVDLGRGAFLALEKGTGDASRAAEQAAVGWHLVALTISAEARETWREHLRVAGHPVERETEHTLYTRDPEQNWIALSHWPSQT